MGNRQYEVKVKRDGVTARLFVHDDDMVELVAADSWGKADYLIDKQRIIKDLVAMARKYNIILFKLLKEGETE